MPCTPATCSDSPHLTDGNIDPNSVAGGPFEHYAHMGWVGSAALNFKKDIGNLSAGSRVTMRVTGADIRLSQEINSSDVIDGRIDKTAYWLGPKIVEGTLNFPIVADNATGGCIDPADVQTSAANLLNAIWIWGTTRDGYGRMCYWNTDIDVRYANHAAFKYLDSIINELNFSVTQSDFATMDLGIIARRREEFNEPLTEPASATFLSPARVLTWNDFSFTGVGACDTTNLLFRSNQVRDFKMTIDNNAERYFTCNGTLYPVDINVGKRDISGSITLLGYNHLLRKRAEGNDSRFTSKDTIRIAAYIGDDRSTTGTSRDWTGDAWVAPTGSIFAKALTGVIFQIEEVSMTNEVLETTVNWLAFGADDNNDTDNNNYEAIIPGTSCDYPSW